MKEPILSDQPEIKCVDQISFALKFFFLKSHKERYEQFKVYVYVYVYVYLYVYVYVYVHVYVSVYVNVFLFLHNIAFSINCI